MLKKLFSKLFHTSSNQMNTTNKVRYNCTNEVLMVSPTAFDESLTGVEDNTFMSNIGNSGQTIIEEERKLAISEFEGLVSVLREAGITVNVKDSVEGAPDSVFPNNWFSTHSMDECSISSPKSTLSKWYSSSSSSSSSSCGALVLYPMKGVLRRTERNPNTIKWFQETKLCGLTYDMGKVNEEKGLFLEGTGSIIFDRIHLSAYMVISHRAHLSLAEEVIMKGLGYKQLIAFYAESEPTKPSPPIYHTNTIMAIGTKWALLASDLVKSPSESTFHSSNENPDAGSDSTSIFPSGQAVVEQLKATNRDVIEISAEQVGEYAANILELWSPKYNAPIIACSTRAYNSLTDEQKQRLLKHVHSIVHAPIPTIELRGGSVRCCLGEIYLNKQK